MAEDSPLPRAERSVRESLASRTRSSARSFIYQVVESMLDRQPLRGMVCRHLPRGSGDGSCCSEFGSCRLTYEQRVTVGVLRRLFADSRRMRPLKWPAATDASRCLIGNLAVAVRTANQSHCASPIDKSGPGALHPNPGARAFGRCTTKVYAAITSNMRCSNFVRNNGT